MTSATTILKRRRVIKVKGGGGVRKAKDRALGSTPPFPVDPAKETEETRARLDKIMKGR